MQLLAEEARAFSQGLANVDAGQLRAILDHIKDVVITVTGDGRDLRSSIRPASAVRLFAGGDDRRVDRAPAARSGRAGFGGARTAGACANVEAVAAHLSRTRRRRAARTARHFPVELVASWCTSSAATCTCICLRDTSERRARPSRRCATARPATARWSRRAPEVIVVIDAQDRATVSTPTRTPCSSSASARERSLDDAATCRDLQRAAGPLPRWPMLRAGGSPSRRCSSGCTGAVDGQCRRDRSAPDGAARSRPICCAPASPTSADRKRAADHHGRRAQRVRAHRRRRAARRSARGHGRR